MVRIHAINWCGTHAVAANATGTQTPVAAAKPATANKVIAEPS